MTAGLFLQCFLRENTSEIGLPLLKYSFNCTFLQLPLFTHIQKVSFEDLISPLCGTNITANEVSFFSFICAHYSFKSPSLDKIIFILNYSVNHIY